MLVAFVTVTVDIIFTCEVWLIRWSEWGEKCVSLGLVKLLSFSFHLLKTSVTWLEKRNSIYWESYTIEWVSDSFLSFFDFVFNSYNYLNCFRTVSNIFPFIIYFLPFNSVNLENQVQIGTNNSFFTIFHSFISVQLMQHWQNSPKFSQ